MSDDEDYQYRGPKVKVVMTFEKDTPGTRRYKEVRENEDLNYILRTQYMTKPTALNFEDTIVVEIRNWDPNLDT